MHVQTPPFFSYPPFFPSLPTQQNLPLPLMIPSLPTRRLHQRPTSILNRNALESIHPRLQHRHAIQVSRLPRSGALCVAELLTRIAHALVLLHQDTLALLALLATPEQPSAMDRPVAQVPVAAEPEGGRDPLGRQHGKVSQDVDDARVDLLGTLGLLGAGLLAREHAGWGTAFALGRVGSGLLLVLDSGEGGGRGLGEEEG